MTTLMVPTIGMMSAPSSSSSSSNNSMSFGTIPRVSSARQLANATLSSRNSAFLVPPLSNTPMTLSPSASPRHPVSYSFDSDSDADSVYFEAMESLTPNPTNSSISATSSPTSSLRGATAMALKNALPAILMSSTPPNVPVTDSPSVPGRVFYLCAQGDLSGLRELQATSPNCIHERDYDGRSPLMCAVMEGHLQVSQFLIDHGADVHARDHSGVTVLMRAIYTRKDQMVHLLLFAHADPNAQGAQDGLTPLMLAATIGNQYICQLLLDWGADPNLVNWKYETALMYAAHQGNVPITRMLLQHRGAVSLRNTDGATAFTFAVSRGHFLVCEEILRFVAADETLQGIIPPSVSAPASSTFQVPPLGGDEWEEDLSPLHVAAMVGNEAITNMILDCPLGILLYVTKGASYMAGAAALISTAWDRLWWRDFRGRTPLMCAAECGQAEIFNLLLERAQDGAVAVLNAKDRHGGAVLHYIASSGSLSCLGYLKSFPISVLPLENIDSRTATPLAVAAAQGHFEMVCALIGMGSRVDTNPNPTNPLLSSCQNGNEGIACLLIHHLTDSLFKKKTSKKDSTTNKKGTTKSIPSDDSIIRPSSINVTDANGWTPLMFAAGKGLLLTSKLLLARGADVNVRGKGNGATALMLATVHGRLALVELLIRSGANVLEKTSTGKTALDLAKQLKRAKISRLISSAVSAATAASSSSLPPSSSSSSSTVSSLLPSKSFQSSTISSSTSTTTSSSTSNTEAETVLEGASEHFSKSTNTNPIPQIATLSVSSSSPPNLSSSSSASSSSSSSSSSTTCLPPSLPSSSSSSSFSATHNVTFIVGSSKNSPEVSSAPHPKPLEAKSSVSSTGAQVTSVPFPFSASSPSSSLGGPAAHIAPSVRPYQPPPPYDQHLASSSSNRVLSFQQKSTSSLIHPPPPYSSALKMLTTTTGIIPPVSNASQTQHQQPVCTTTTLPPLPSSTTANAGPPPTTTTATTTTTTTTAFTRTTTATTSTASAAPTGRTAAVHSSTRPISISGTSTLGITASTRRGSFESHGLNFPPPSRPAPSFRRGSFEGQALNLPPSRPAPFRRGSSSESFGGSVQKQDGMTSSSPPRRLSGDGKHFKSRSSSVSSALPPSKEMSSIPEGRSHFSQGADTSSCSSTGSTSSLSTSPKKTHKRRTSLTASTTSTTAAAGAPSTQSQSTQSLVSVPMTQGLDPKDRRLEVVGQIRYNRSLRLGTGSQGTQVYQGFFKNIPAAIKRLPRHHSNGENDAAIPDSTAEREIKLLIALSKQQQQQQQNNSSTALRLSFEGPLNASSWASVSVRSHNNKTLSNSSTTKSANNSSAFNVNCSQNSDHYNSEHDWIATASDKLNNIIARGRNNIVRYFGKEVNEDFIFLAMEQCSFTLQKLVKDTRASAELFFMFYSKPILSQTLEPLPPVPADVTLPQNSQAHPLLLRHLPVEQVLVTPTSFTIKLLFDLFSGIAYLHSLNIVHNDLKPANVLLTGTFGVKIADMGLARSLGDEQSSFSFHSGPDGLEAVPTGLGGFFAPEVILEGRKTRKVDVFSAGCLAYTVLSMGGHPFELPGMRGQRDSNIIAGRYDLSRLSHLPEAKDMIERMIQFDPAQRPTMAQCLQHCFFKTVSEQQQ